MAMCTSFCVTRGHVVDLVSYPELLCDDELRRWRASVLAAPHPDAADPHAAGTRRADDPAPAPRVKGKA